ncbi:glycosyltransferase, partial [Streptomyces cyaneofuscatus]|uniref:glycosyltransferase n=1 Tax=Streptomyces cyaneofuscatus TaxID=66883 RepID=UPI00341C7ADF
MNDGGQRQFGPLGKVLVIIPTYNEVENIRPIVDRVRTAVPDADILVADDNSPDGTGKAADERTRWGSSMSASFAAAVEVP